MPSMQPVSVAFSPDGTRAAFRVFHPKGNSITAFLEKRSPRWSGR
jgi:hypothetical protein